MSTTERRVVVGGLPFFGRRLAALLDGPGWRVRYLETRAWEPRAALRALRRAAAADLIYLVGGQIASFSRPHLLRLVLRRPTIMHWAGSDVLYARRSAARGRVTASLRDGVTHWAGAPWLVEELRPLGVRTTWRPHSWVVAPATLPPLPSHGGGQTPFTVLTYLPERRAAFYGAAAVCRLAAALPDVRVLVVGARTLAGGAPANVRCLGWVERMAPIYAEAHVLLRLPRHDGLAFMVQEALAHGRYAIWNHPFPGAIQATTPEAATAAVEMLWQRHAAGELPLNEAGADYTRARFSPARIRADLLAGFSEVLAR